MPAELPRAVRVIDPETASIEPAVLTTGSDGAIRIAPAPGSNMPDDPVVYLSPGWADLHTHVYDGTTELGVHPDRVGLDAGVHLLADAGSAGQATLRGLLHYVLPTARTPVRVWLNIGSHGLVHLHETAHPSFIDVDATLAAVEKFGNVVCGIKVRSSGAVVGSMHLQPLQLGRLVAREAGLPLLVHIGEAPPPIGDVLDLLDAGDVVTHCYHGKLGTPWQRDGTPVPQLRAALERGVLLDVGHGAASFDVGVARAAVGAGFAPHSISTDIHIRNIGGPVYGLADVMTKLLACDMPLTDVIRAVTTTPRRIVRADQPWRAEDGTVLHATLFTLDSRPPAGRDYVDAGGRPVACDRYLRPLGTITAAGWTARAGRSCPDPNAP